MKIVWLFLLLLMSGLVWLTESYNNIPFYAPSEQSHVEVIDKNTCVPSELIKEKASKAIYDAGLLGGSGGFYAEACGLFTTSFGVSDKANAKPFELDTVTRIASISKPMTAVAIMQLHENGKLNINDTIDGYLLNAPVEFQPITIRQLLNHTSGISHYTSSFDAMSFTQYATLEAALAIIYSRGVEHPVGEQYVYSSFGYTVLGRIIEIVSQTSYEQYMREYIWLKSGMNNTSIELSHHLNNKSKLYINIGGFNIKSPRTDLSIIYPAGGIQSTANDILMFGKAILDNTLINRESLELMIDITNEKSTLIGDDPYGLGWSVYHHPELGRIISHSGSQPGVSGLFQILLDKGVSSVALSNAYGTKNSIRQLTYDFAGLVMD